MTRISRIAAAYGTYATTLAQANCLSDPNVISVGQVLHVPGDAPPPEQTYDCSWTLLTPHGWHAGDLRRRHAGVRLARTARRRAT